MTRWLTASDLLCPSASITSSLSPRARAPVCSSHIYWLSIHSIAVTCYITLCISIPLIYPFSTPDCDWCRTNKKWRQHCVSWLIFSLNLLTTSNVWSYKSFGHSIPGLNFRGYQADFTTDTVLKFVNKMLTGTMFRFRVLFEANSRFLIIGNMTVPSFSFKNSWARSRIRPISASGGFYENTK